MYEKEPELASCLLGWRIAFWHRRLHGDELHVRPGRTRSVVVIVVVIFGLFR